MFGYYKGKVIMGYTEILSLVSQSVRRQLTPYFFVSSLEMSFEVGVSRQHYYLPS
jgi:hypothetical protein